MIAAGERRDANPSGRASGPVHPVWLIRHAATPWTGTRWCGRADPDLTAAGRRAADALAVQLAPELPADAAIWSSPARRAQATATAIGRAGEHVVVVEDLLAEVDFGRVEGLTWTELSTAEPDLVAALVGGGPIDWPGGETAGALAARAETMAGRIVRARRHHAVVVVSHGAFIHALARSLGLGGDLAAVLPCGVVRLAP